MALAPWNGGRSNNLVGMNRDNAPSKAVDPGLIARITGAVGSLFGMASAQQGSPELPFFPPGNPLGPMAQGAAGRRFDYPINYNATIRARTSEPIDFETLRAIADPSHGGWDLIRLAIETRKDQMAKLTYSILPRKPADAKVRPKSDGRCQEVETFLRRPDGVHSWADWSRMVIEEHLVIDAPVIYKRPTLGGDKPARLELLDGALIKPLLNYDGRRPEVGPAFVQNLKGLPAVHYTADEVIYAPRNPRVNKVFGYSPTEQVLVTVNIALRRQAGQLGFFTEGTVPDAVAQVPLDWGMQRIQEFQDYWDTMVNDAVRRRKLKFIPGGTTFQATRNDQALVDQFDEWLARVVQYCFSLPPTPLVRMMNRATSENAYEQSLDEGLQPLMIWMKNIVEDIMARWFGFTDLEMVWDDIKKTDPAEKEERDLALVAVGVISRDDMRAERGLEPLGIPPIVAGIGPMGFMSIDAMKQAIANGWDLTGMPQPGLGGLGGEMGPGGADPSQLGSGGPGDPLNGMPPEILQALGIDPTQQQSSGDQLGQGDTGTPESSETGQPPDNSGGGDNQHLAHNSTAAQADSNVVPIHKHPHVLAALQNGEAHAKRLASRMAGAGR